MTGTWASIQANVTILSPHSSGANSDSVSAISLNQWYLKLGQTTRKCTTPNPNSLSSKRKSSQNTDWCQDEEKSKLRVMVMLCLK